MKDYKKRLTSFIEIVTFLLAAFGGFLKTVAPPIRPGASYAVGISSFFMLIILLIVSAVARRQASPSTRKKWLIAGIALFLVALVSGFGYPVVLGEYTYPERVDLRERKICASDIYLTSAARQYKQTNPSANAEDLEQNLPDGDIWSAQGIKKAEMTLLTTYVAFVLSIAGAIFCLLEASVSQGENSSVAVTQ